MLQNINFHIFFKVCKPIRTRHKISVNCLLVLNGAYLLQLSSGKSFTRYRLLKFVTYYDNVRIGKYITVLTEHKFIIESDLYKGHQTFILSSLGLSVIKELNESYEIELRKFIDLYNIVL